MNSRFVFWGYDLRIVAILVAIAIILGLLNNLRQPEEQQARLFESTSAEPATEVIQ